LQKYNKNKHQGMPVTKKHGRGTHTPVEQKVERKESEGSLEANGEGGVVNCSGRGEHAPTTALLVNDQAAALGSRGAGDDDGMARVGAGLPE
jgi:hypothetical protein